MGQLKEDNGIDLIYMFYSNDITFPVSYSKNSVHWYKLLFKSIGFCYDIDLFTVIFTRTAFKNLFNQDNHFFLLCLVCIG